MSFLCVCWACVQMPSCAFGVQGLGGLRRRRGLHVARPPLRFCAGCTASSSLLLRRSTVSASGGGALASAALGAACCGCASASAAAWSCGGAPASSAGTDLRPELHCSRIPLSASRSVRKSGVGQTHMPYEHAQITQTCSQQDDWGGRGGRWGPRADSSVAATARLHQARNPTPHAGVGMAVAWGRRGPAAAA